MKFLLLLVLSIPAATLACPTLISFNISNYAFDGIYENTNYKYRSSNVELLKGDLSDFSKTLHPDEDYYDPDSATVGGCAYYDLKKSNDVSTEIFATFWPEGTLSLTIIHNNGKNHYITADVTKDSGFFYDTTYGPYDSSFLEDHKFADILTAKLKLIYAN